MTRNQLELIEAFISDSHKHLTIDEIVDSGNLCVTLALNGFGADERTIKALRVVLNYTEFVVGLQKE